MGQPYLPLEICELHQQDLTGILLQVEAQLLSQSRKDGRRCSQQEKRWVPDTSLLLHYY